MLDRTRLEIVRCLTSNNGSLSAREREQVDNYLDTYPSYFMDGIHAIPVIRDYNGKIEEVKVDIRPIPQKESDWPEFNI